VAPPAHLHAVLISSDQRSGKLQLSWIAMYSFAHLVSFQQRHELQAQKLDMHAMANNSGLKTLQRKKRETNKDR
jgi:hypothetical protein